MVRQCAPRCPQDGLLLVSILTLAISLARTPDRLFVVFGGPLAPSLAQVRGALALFDFDDSSADTIRGFLLQCAAHPKFLLPPAASGKVRVCVPGRKRARQVTRHTRGRMRPRS